MSSQRRSQNSASFHSSIPQRLLKNRLLTTRAIKNDFSQSHRRQKKNDSLFEITLDEALDKDEVEENIDFDADSDDIDFDAFFIRSRHDIERTIFIHKRNDNERQTKIRRKDEIQS